MSEYRRVLGEKTRHLHDHGRHLHARLCILQCKTGLPGPLDPAEPARVSEAIAKLGLAHMVITSVDRDDLPTEAPRILPRSSVPCGRNAATNHDRES